MQGVSYKKDVVIYKGAPYHFLSGAIQIALFEPCEYGFIPDKNHDPQTPEGYLCLYRFIDDGLILDSFSISDVDRYYPAVAYKEPVFKEKSGPYDFPDDSYIDKLDIEYAIFRNGEAFYHQVMLEIRSTGRFILEDDEKWLEFTLYAGKIDKIRDLSKIREQYEAYYRKAGKDRPIETLPYGFMWAHWWLFDILKKKEYRLDLDNAVFDLEKRCLAINEDLAIPFEHFSEADLSEEKEVFVKTKGFFRKKTIRTEGDIVKAHLRLCSSADRLVFEDDLPLDLADQLKEVFPDLRIKTKEIEIGQK